MSEGIPAFGWILVSPTPAPHIKEMSDAAQFYSNRVLKDFKEKEPIHAEWVKQWLKILNELHAYVKQYHTTGLTWGVQNVGNGAAQTPPPTAAMAKMQIDGNGLKHAINALGPSATAHLRSVPDEMKTHKNPQLKEQPVTRTNKSQVSRRAFARVISFRLVFRPPPRTLRPTRRPARRSSHSKGTNGSSNTNPAGQICN